MSEQDGPVHVGPYEVDGRLERLEERLRGEIQRAIATSFAAHTEQAHTATLEAWADGTGERGGRTTEAEVFRVVTNLATELRVASHDLGGARAELRDARSRLELAEARIERWQPIVEAMTAAVGAKGAEQRVQIEEACRLALELRGGLRVVP